LLGSGQAGFPAECLEDQYRHAKACQSSVKKGEGLVIGRVRVPTQLLALVRREGGRQRWLLRFFNFEFESRDFEFSQTELLLEFVDSLMGTTELFL
jgi:hypothetical protein